MNTDLSIIKLISEASLVVQIVIALLVFASFLSWALILVKSGKLRQARRATAKFDEQFWSGISLNTLYDELGEKNQRQALERIFYDGFHEYKRIYTAEANVSFPIVDAVGRTMRVAVAREVSQLEQNIAFLATVGSTAPYIGLFGTVWGIMNSFISIGAMKQATLAVVAPGIAEALIATAFGLFAAIPASIAYNRFNDSIDHLDSSYENFKDEFLSLLERQVLLKKG
jgi:biopolymer transport protein TolQ